MNSSSDKKLVGHAFSAAFVAFVRPLWPFLEDHEK